MPRLNYPKITKGNAIATLLRLYRQEPEFMKELDEVRQPYLVLLNRFAKEGITFFIEHDLSPNQYVKAVIDYHTGHSEEDPFPSGKFQYMSQLQPYFDGLAKLAHKWKLNAPWAVGVLSFCDLIDLIKPAGGSTEVDIPLGDLEFIYPWTAPCPPLEVKISAWDIINFGREQVLTEIAENLRIYEGQIKAKGLHEYPSAVEEHARLWFEHYVHRKKYKELLNGCQLVDEDSIRRAVMKFRRLLGISINR